MALAIDLSDHQAQVLAEAAARLQVSNADLAAAAVRDLIAQAAAPGFSLIQNHPVVDGTMRIGHASLELTLVLNDLELTAGVDAAEAAVLSVASGAMNRESYTQRVIDNHRSLPGG